ncbi:hypothetical protein SynMVIR181_02603 [Synechococcus sp. MVIR-18-1]|nr:hypothetical protein SynMVIR181_02603 [Synechococcus sp. MVIR-18-1]
MSLTYQHGAYRHLMLALGNDQYKMERQFIQRLRNVLVVIF